MLVAGYVVATPLTFMVLRIAWRRQALLFAALEAGIIAITVGYALQGRRWPAWFHAGWFFGFAAMWVVVGRIRRRREGTGT